MILFRYKVTVYSEFIGNEFKASGKVFADSFIEATKKVVDYYEYYEKNNDYQEICNIEIEWEEDGVDSVLEEENNFPEIVKEASLSNITIEI